MPLIRTISGLRSTLSDESLNTKIIEKYAKGLDSYLPEGRIVIGRDGRPSGKMIEEVMSETLSNCGREVVLTGIVPTPTVQIVVEHTDAVAGIAITASHNPSDWNGMKFINSDGVFFDADENQEFWNIVDNNIFRNCNTEGIIIEDSSAISFHINKILEIPFISKSIKIIKSRRYKIAVDAVNASGSIAVPTLLKELGCTVVPLYCDNSGIFPHEPEPLPKNLTELAKCVLENSCDFGLAIDPDADRLVLVNEIGNTLSEELTLAVAVHSVLEHGQKEIKKSIGKVVTNLSSSLVTKDIASMFNCEVLLSSVGEINVVKKMKECSAIIGGEGSGGVILPDCHYGRDSLVGIALVLIILANRDIQMSQLISQYPNYYIIKHKQEYSGDFQNYCNKLVELFPNCNINREDGIRIDIDNCWVQARQSNTEPIVRIIAESKNEDKAKELLEKAIMVLNY